MEKLISKPTKVELSTIESASWSVPLSGLINFKNYVSEKAGLLDRDEPIKVFAHVIHHPKFGYFLIDTGVSEKFKDNPSSLGISWLVKKNMHLEKMKIQKSTAQILIELPEKINGVFFTHLHLDHISGMPDIANDIPLYIGKSESTEKYFINMFVKHSTDNILNSKASLHEWEFSKNPNDTFEGIIDIFSDHTVFALSVPGHTSGSTAYLVRTINGPVLITGDTCHTLWGWQNSVEPGDFTRDQSKNRESLIKLKKMVEKFPEINVRLGHQ